MTGYAYLSLQFSSVIKRDQPIDQTDQRRFPTARLPAQNYDLSLFDLQVHML